MLMMTDYADDQEIKKVVSLMTGKTKVDKKRN